MNILVINIIIAFFIFGIGLMFLEGIWSGKGTVIKGFGNIDNFFFSKIKDRRVLKVGDQLSFIICIIMALCTLANGLVYVFNSEVPNISAIFLFVAVVLTWPIRLLFINRYKDSKFEDVPRIWPFPKERITT
jgi:hypothetical protein